MFFNNIYSLKIFQSIPKEIVDSIIDNSEIREYKEGEIILVEGISSNGEGYIIKNGRVAISIKGQKIVDLNAGDIFGEIALLNEEKRSATVKASSDLEVIVLNMENMIELLNNDQSELNKTILKRIEENIERE